MLPISSTNLSESGFNSRAPRNPFQRLVRSRLSPPAESHANHRLLSGGTGAFRKATGLEARTIPRLLETDPRTGTFRRNEEIPLECDLLVVDETSMVDVPLMRALLRRATNSKRPSA